MKDEATMLVYGIFFFALHRQCLTEFLSPRILYHKRFVVEDCGCIPIMIENNIMWLEGRGSISIKDDDVCTIILSGFCLGKASPKDFLSKVWQKSFSQVS